jgi:hypothetical protein
MDRARLNRDLENFGVLRATWRRLGNAAERFLGLHVYVVMTRETAGVDPPENVPDGVEFVSLDRDRALVAAARQPELELSPSFVDHAFARGDVCRAAVRDGKVLGYAWLSSNGFTPHEDGVALSYPPGSFYSGTAFVAPDSRGQNLMVKLNRTNMILMAQRGSSTEIGFTAIHNISARGSKRYPWTLKRRDGALSDDIGYAGYLRWGARVRCFRSRAVRDLGIGFEPCASPLPGAVGRPPQPART